MKVSIVFLVVFIALVAREAITQKTAADEVCEKRSCVGNQVGKVYAGKCICECPNINDKCCEGVDLWRFFDPTWCSWNLTATNNVLSSVSASVDALTGPTTAIMNSIGTIAPTLAPLAESASNTLTSILTAIAPAIISMIGTASSSASDLQPLLNNFVQAATNYTYEQATCCV